MVLLSILNDAIDTARGIKISAITIDEGISGYRDESLKIVSEFCSKLDVPLTILSYKELFGTHMDEAIKLRPTAKLTSCSICGTFRRRAIDLAAEQIGANVIATAHNLDDEVQTFMINLFAGDVNRMGWNQASSTYKTGHMKKIKPLSETYEREVVFYALQKRIPFQSEQCPYMSESIREEIRQFLNRLEKGTSWSKIQFVQVYRGYLNPCSGQERSCYCEGGLREVWQRLHWADLFCVQSSGEFQTIKLDLVQLGSNATRH